MEKSALNCASAGKDADSYEKVTRPTAESLRLSPLAPTCIFHVGSSYGSHNSAPRRREVRSQYAGPPRDLRPAGRQWRIRQRYDTARILTGFLGDLRRVLRRAVYEGKVIGAREPGSEGQRRKGDAACATRTVSDRGHRSWPRSATSGRRPAGSQGVPDPQHPDPRALDRNRGDHASSGAGRLETLDRPGFLQHGIPSGKLPGCRRPAFGLRGFRTATCGLCRGREAFGRLSTLSRIRRAPSRYDRPVPGTCARCIAFPLERSRAKRTGERVAKHAGGPRTRGNQMSRPPSAPSPRSDSKHI